MASGMSAQTSAPLVIIGAPRSGTNMLRDVLSSMAGFSTWPCDELNAMWLHTNREVGHDELVPSQVTERLERTVRRAFARQQARAGDAVVVEKTCSNSLRVPFVDELVDGVRYLWLVRDGREAALSAMERWRASVEIGYLLRKARFAPLSDLPALGWSMVSNRIAKGGREGALPTWGPRFLGIDEMVATEPLHVVSSAQWSRCVTASVAAFADMDPSRFLKVRYEDFVAAPVEGLRTVVDWVGVDTSPGTVADAVRAVSPSRGGRWSSIAGTPQEGEMLSALRPGLDAIADAW
jgi:hypothetical protein